MLDKGAYRDRCSCLCSPQGCTPLSKLAKAEVVRWSPEGQDKERLNALWKAWLTQADAKGDDYWTFAQELLRFIAFKKLGVVHTCCTIVWWANKVTPSSVPHSESNDLDDTEYSDDEELLDVETRIDEALDEYDRRAQACCCPPADKLLCALSEESHCVAAPAPGPNSTAVLPPITPPSTTEPNT